MSWTGNLLVPFVLLGWPAVVIFLCMAIGTRRGVVTGLVAGFLFLPGAALQIVGVPEYGKALAISLGALLGILLTAPRSLLALRFKAFDLVVAVMVLAPMASSLSNGLGVYDGLSAAFSMAIGVLPGYVVGRSLFGSPQSLRALALGICIGGLVYLPLCLWEIRMSPQLLGQVYGIPIKFAQNVRYGSYRPCVFLGHGLPLSAFMRDATLCAYALWRTGAVRTLFNVPMLPFVIALFLITVLAKGTFSLALMLLGLGVLEVGFRLRSLAPLFLFALIPVVFVSVRATGATDGEWLLRAAERVFREDRVGSARIRMENDTALAAKARQRPIFGWGGWGRHRIYDEQGRDVSITDSRWCIAFGVSGAVGLAALYAFASLPVLVLRKRLSAKLSRAPSGGGVLAAALLVTCWAYDMTQNVGSSILPNVLIGGLVSLASMNPIHR